jgi:hypothetical protein
MAPPTIAMVIELPSSGQPNPGSVASATSGCGSSGDAIEGPKAEASVDLLLNHKYMIVYSFDTNEYTIMKLLAVAVPKNT